MKKYFFGITSMLVITCGNNNTETTAMKMDSGHSCMKVPARFANNDSALNSIQNSGDTSFAGMKLITGGTFEMGGDNKQAAQDEYPKHQVQVDGFYIDEMK